ncbi:signal peptidase I [Clostridioides difficile CD160]|nr:signal peptidase I [Clostridioides difficile CD160]
MIKKKSLSKVSQLFIVVFIGISLSVIISKFVVSAGIVPTNSMSPTISKDSTVVLSRLNPQNGYKYGDIIAFTDKKTSDNLFKILLFGREEKLYIKRVIGVEGDTVEIINGVVYINDKSIKEDYILYNDSLNIPKVKIPKGNYYLLGDNRVNSEDSRYWKDTFLKSNKIVGKIIYVMKK